MNVMRGVPQFFWVLVFLAACSATTPNELVEFSELRVGEIGAERAVVRFETSVEASCELEFGVEEAELTRRATDPDMDPDNPYSVNHRVPLEDLAVDTQIFFRARATNRAGVPYYSAVDSFRTIQRAAFKPGGAALEGSVNVALLESGARISEVSSNFGGAANGETWGASAALDGLMATEWSSNGDGDTAFLVIELSEPTELRGFGYRSRKMQDGSSIVHSVELQLDGETVLGPFATPDPDQRYVFEFPMPIVAHTVRVQASETTGGNTGAKEIELLAQE